MVNILLNIHNIPYMYYINIHHYTIPRTMEPMVKRAYGLRLLTNPSDRLKASLRPGSDENPLVETVTTMVEAMNIYNYIYIY